MPDAPLSIWFHGTSRECAEKIMREGFRPGTNFAAHLEDSMSYGGHVFEVALRRAKTDWQWDCLESIPPGAIVSYRIYAEPRTIAKNDQLRETVLREYLAGEGVDGDEF